MSIFAFSLSTLQYGRLERVMVSGLLASGEAIDLELHADLLSI